MPKISLGIVSGFVLGLLDGATAVFSPDGRSMLLIIVASASVKGAITGGAVGLVARRVRGLRRNAAAGGIIGAVLSLLAAVPSGAYLQIVPSGVVLGVVVGLIVARWGR